MNGKKELVFCVYLCVISQRKAKIIVNEDEKKAKEKEICVSIVREL